MSHEEAPHGVLKVVLLIKTELCPSPIQGLGCFTLEDIPWGKKVWQLTPGFDIFWTPRQWEALPSWQREHLERHAYLHKQFKLWVYCSDDARFFNHQPFGKCNVTQADSLTDISARDIKAGEELTCDYSAFCDDALDMFGEVAK